MQTILFDLDGTLLDTAPDLHTAVNTLRADYELPPLEHEVVLAMVGKGAHHLIKRVLTVEKQHDFSLEIAYQKFARYYHAINGQRTREFDGVSQTLRELKAAGHRLAIVTNKPAEFTLPLVHQFGWDDMFQIVVSGDTLPVKKPDPQPIIYACTQMGVKAEDALMVGDSMNDVHAAQAANCPVVVLDYGYNEGEHIAVSLQNTPNVPVFSDFRTAVMRFLRIRILWISGL